LFYLLADGFNAMNTAFATRPAERDSWETARSTLVDTFLAVDGARTPMARFHNRNFPVVGASRCAGRATGSPRTTRSATHDGWARGLGQRFGESVRGPSVGAGLSLLLDVYSDAPSRAATGGLLTYLLDDTGAGSDNNLGTTLTAAADVIQILRADDEHQPPAGARARAGVPARDAGRRRGATARRCARRSCRSGLRFLDRSREYDTDNVLDHLLGNVAQRPANPLLADEPLVVIGDAIAETQRVHPGVGGPMDAADFAQVFAQVARFFPRRHARARTVLLHRPASEVLGCAGCSALLASRRRRRRDPRVHAPRADPATRARGGFYLAPRGVRPLGRGGAFVAGADDQNAAWYNPAGLAQAGSGVLIDLSYIGFLEQYTRQAVAPTVGNMAGMGGAITTFAPSARNRFRW